MKSGAQAIVQAGLASGEWKGRADVLLLFGIVTTDEDGGAAYQARWALDRREQRTAFRW